MRCEIIAVGTEITLGHIIDTNSTWISRQLSAAGIDSHYQTRVDDNLDRIVGTLENALARNDAVIMCGGLGPTQDDITREGIAKVMGVPLDYDETAAEKIRKRFEARGRKMPEINLCQAQVPRGASVIRQMPGTAPGLICPLREKVIYAVPGVPWEMKTMITDSVIPDLKHRAGVGTVIKSRILRTWGRSESRLAELLSKRIEVLESVGNPTLAFQASGIEGIKIRITAKAVDEPQADLVNFKEERELRKILGDVVFAVDDENMESTVLGLMREKGLSLAVAESITGGLIGARLTAVPGASDVFRGAVVAYASDVKYETLGVSEGPVVSNTAARALAKGVRTLLKADIGIATTGVAGPTEQEGQPVGTVFIGLAFDGENDAHELHLSGDRQQIRKFTVISALNLLRLRLLGACRTQD